MLRSEPARSEVVLYLGPDDAAAGRCARALRREGFSVTRVSTISEAAAACRDHRVHVVVFDARGIRNCRRVIEQLDGCGATVIVIAPAPIGRAAIRRGAWEYLDCRNPGYVQDVAPAAVRAAAFARVRGECARGLAVAERRVDGTPTSLADAVASALMREIATPLLALRGYRELLAVPGAFDASVTALANRVGSQAEELRGLVDRLTRALRAESRREVGALVATDFNRVVGAAVERAARASRRRIGWHPAPLLPTLLIDRPRVARLLDGLFSLVLWRVARGGGVDATTTAQRGNVVLRLQARPSGVGRLVDLPGLRQNETTAVAAAFARVVVGAHGGELTVQEWHGRTLGLVVRLPVRDSQLAVGV
ncbi:MAG TPA: hypothetical protein VMW17_09620 [Candidatus Binatia bacterium]|nr:hypothetical protein [Candidatus Binatia bacterium]